jgi:hypothetical protein
MNMDTFVYFLPTMQLHSFDSANACGSVPTTFIARGSVIAPRRLCRPGIDACAPACFFVSSFPLLSSRVRAGSLVPLSPLLSSLGRIDYSVFVCSLAL